MNNGKKSAAIRRRNALATGVPRKLSKDFTNAKLRAEQVAAIRLEYASGGVTYKELEAKYQISDSAVGSLLREETWRDADGPTSPDNKNKLTAEAVRAIREEYAKGGVSYQRLGERYGVTGGAVLAAVRRRNWRHVD